LIEEALRQRFRGEERKCTKGHNHPYLWLIGSEGGELIYVSPEGLKSFTVKEALTEREVIELIKDGKTPRWPEWECQYCQ
jgi:hypothetical protein